MEYKIKEALKRTTDTKECLVGADVVSRCGEVFGKMFKDKKAIIVTCGNIWDIAGKQVYDSLTVAGIEQYEPYIFNDSNFYAEWKFVERLIAHLEKLDAIAVAVGSGVINDLVKYASSVLGRKYMCVGTTASMDGYTAYGASITKDGNKQTFNCPAPYVFVMDAKIAAEAPKSLVASGYADLVAKIPAGADWLLADCVGAEKIDTFAWDLIQAGLRESLSYPTAVHEGDVDKVEALCKELLMSGLAMQIIQSSRPASGAEHQFSHYWDMENLSYPNGVHVSHGFKVGIGTLVSTACLEFLLEQDIENLDVEACVTAWPAWEEMKAHIEALCEGKPGLLSRCLAESEAKYADAASLRTQLEALKGAWPTLKEQIRAQIIPFDEVYESLKKVGAPYEPEMICLSREHLRKTFAYIPFMHSRFTNIDTIYRIGLLPALEAKLFGKGGRWEIQ